VKEDRKCAVVSPAYLFSGMGVGASQQSVLDVLLVIKIRN